MGIINRIRCLFGKHGWEFFSWQGEGGYAIGLKCLWCGAWHPSATRVAYAEEEDDAKTD